MSSRRSESAGHADRHHGETMIEIFAEFSGGDIGLDIAAGRGHDAHVDRDLGVAADALEGLVDQDAQNLVLRLARHVGDLVDEQRAAMRLFERTDLAARRAIAAVDAEQFDFHVVRRDRGGIDDDERPIGARRMAVNGARGKLLAAAGGADDQDAAIGRRDLFDRLAQLIGGGRVSDQRGRERRELFELAHLAPQPRILQRPLGDQQQTIGLERLLDEVVSAALDRGNRGFDIAVTGNHHDRQFGMILLEPIQQLQPVEAAALQPDVEEDEIGPPRDDGSQRLIAVARRAGSVTFVLQDARDQFADVRFVVDDQNIGCHGLNRRPVTVLPIIRSSARFVQQVSFTRHLVSISFVTLVIPPPRVVRRLRRPRSPARRQSAIASTPRARPVFCRPRRAVQACRRVLPKRD